MHHLADAHRQNHINAQIRVSSAPGGDFFHISRFVDDAFIFIYLFIILMMHLNAWLSSEFSH